ncbi:MAG: hypothetical protein IKW37_01500 [Bacteroidaceae bacterium]|nr:hypothetical protein [Bacteroidaceae bacterium]
MSAGVDFTKELQAQWATIDKSIRHQLKSRSYRAANELRNASQLVLRGQRHGRRYIVPGTGRVKYNKRTKKAKITYKYYTASAPGEPPAVRTGAFRMGWKPKSYVKSEGKSKLDLISRVENLQRTDNGKYLLGELLEEGTNKMAPRPHHEKIQEMALPKIMKIYNEPYV